MFVGRAHPWVLGSSHCVVLVLWLTKYTLSLESTRLSGAEQKHGTTLETEGGSGRKRKTRAGPDKGQHWRSPGHACVTRTVRL